MKPLLPFTLVYPKSIDEAAVKLKGKTKLIAGGTDLLGVLKDRILPDYPEALMDLKTISGLDYIKEETGVLKIGALAKLSDVSESSTVMGKYAALAQAAHAVGSPLLRNMGTLGGNLCQEVRCWYYRYPYFLGGRLFCLRKGGTACFAVTGDNRYHAILRGAGCFAVCPSDTAIALTALNANIITNKKSIPIDNFFQVLGDVLAADEIVTEIQIPSPKTGTKQTFTKFALRKAIDFALVSVATAITISGGSVSDARIVLGAVAPMPYRATGAEDAIKGKAINETLADTAAAAAVKDAVPLANNAYKIQIAKTLVKRAILA